MTSGLTSLLWFIAILALIPAALWLMKRTPMGGAGTAGVMRTVAVLSVAPNQRLMTVEVGSGDDRRWLVLGVTAQQINTLHTMAPQAEVAAPGPGFASSPFAQLMSRVTGNKGPQS
jgi:flagellar protein FliO/FliZ